MSNLLVALFLVYLKPGECYSDAMHLASGVPRCLEKKLQSCSWCFLFSVQFRFVTRSNKYSSKRECKDKLWFKLHCYPMERTFS